MVPQTCLKYTAALPALLWTDAGAGRFEKVGVNHREEGLPRGKPGERAPGQGPHKKTPGVCNCRATRTTLCPFLSGATPRPWPGLRRTRFAATRAGQRLRRLLDLYRQLHLTGLGSLARGSAGKSLKSSPSACLLQQHSEPFRMGARITPATRRGRAHRMLAGRLWVARLDVPQRGTRDAGAPQRALERAAEGRPAGPLECRF